MQSAAKHGVAENNRVISVKLIRLHQRLQEALNLGSWEDRGKWHSSDIEIQRLVLHSTDAFLGCISSEIMRHELVKNSLVDIVRALRSILEFRNQSLSTMASEIAVKLISIVPSSTMQSHVFNLLSPLADLLSSQQPQVALSCATALNIFLSKLSSRKEREVWHVLEETKAVGHLVHNVKHYSHGVQPIEYFQEMASVLSGMLWRWPSIRYSVWNDSDFLNSLDALKLISENSVRVLILQLYSALALCGNGAEKLLENGELIHIMVDCMDTSNTRSVRVEAFKLARCFAHSKRGCMKMMNICCEALVKAVIVAMNEWNSLSEKLAKSQMSLVEEACHLALITRWPGDHHKYFWQEGIDRVLLDLLLDDYHKIHQLQHELSVSDLINIVQESPKANCHLFLRPFVWDILGGLAANCASALKHGMDGSERRLNVLIICACSAFIDSIRTLRQISQNTLTNMSESEPAVRAVMMMVYSPCTSLANLSRKILCEIVKPSGKVYVEYFLQTLNTRFSGKKFGLPGDLQILVCLMSMACYCSSPKYRKLLIKFQGKKFMVAFIKWLLNNPVHMQRASMVPHLHDYLSERHCCSPGPEEWEGEEMLLLSSMLILAELLDQSSLGEDTPFGNLADLAEAQLIQELQQICRHCSSPGSRWYAAYILSYFGLFGFPSKVGDRIGKLLGEDKHADLKLDLVHQEAVIVHEIIIMVRCPSLLRPEKKSSNESKVKHDLEKNTIRTVHLSAQVDRQSLLKLLEYIYSGCLQATDDLVKKLKILAKHCKLEALQQILRRRNPKWGTPFPSFDLSPALAPTAHNSSNLILEAKTTQLVGWKCHSCSALIPHLHVHKVILESSCEYLQGLFRSGMQESHSQTVKVPVSWESLRKLISWFYSDQLSVPKYDCTWNNLDSEEKFQEILPYLELCWLAEFWLIEGLHEECYNVVVSCVKSSKRLSTKIIQTAANLSQWQLTQIAADHMARSYHNLRNSGELDTLDDNLVEMVRLASVRLSQEGSGHLH